MARAPSNSCNGASVRRRGAVTGSGPASVQATGTKRREPSGKCGSRTGGPWRTICCRTGRTSPQSDWEGLVMDTSARSWTWVVLRALLRRHPGLPAAKVPRRQDQGRRRTAHGRQVAEGCGAGRRGPEPVRHRDASGRSDLTNPPGPYSTRRSRSARPCQAPWSKTARAGRSSQLARAVTLKGTAYPITFRPVQPVVGGRGYSEGDSNRPTQTG